MSTSALKDCNVLPVSDLEKHNESSKGNFCNPSLEDCSVNLDYSQNVNSSVSLSASLMRSVAEINGAEVGNSEVGNSEVGNSEVGNSEIGNSKVGNSEIGNSEVGNSEVGNSEVEYIETENLTDLLSVDATLNTLMARLDSKDWVSVCEALNNLRQLTVYHKERLSDLLGDLIGKIVKSLKNPRSAVCKTAIMTCGDIFKVYNDSIIDFLDPLLVPLLLKSSQDKRFVCEASESALISMTTWISPSLLLPKLQPYLKNRNPRVRAKASMCFSRSVPRLGVEGIKVYGINKLIQIAASQLSDQLPESREAARSLVVELQNVYEGFQLLSSEDSSQSANNISWEAFCNAELSALSAQAILRVTSIQKGVGGRLPTQNV